MSVHAYSWNQRSIDCVVKELKNAQIAAFSGELIFTEIEEETLAKKILARLGKLSEKANQVEREKASAHRYFMAGGRDYA